MTSLLLQQSRIGLDEFVAIRRDLHAHPELGFEETRTAGLVAAALRGWGITVTEGVGRTGVVGTIHGNRPGPRAIGLRADMDALAMQEHNDLPHASCQPGRMHGCGHDGHTAMLLGAARALAANPDFAGTVHLIFQPAEEGRGGALAMLEDGLLERFPCERLFGLHSYPDLPVGHFGTRAHALMAASGRWRATFSGTGGHGGAAPHRSTDLSLAMAHFVLALPAIVARDVPPTETAIISVGHVHAGDAAALNVLPAELKLGGTMRAFTPDIQQLLERRMQELVQAQASAYGASAELTCSWNSIPLSNDPEATRSAVAAAIAVAGAHAVAADTLPVTGGEDFAYMMRQRPGAFMFIGNGRRPGPGGDDLHTPHYDFNDDALPYGIAYWLALVDHELDGRIGTA